MAGQTNSVAKAKRRWMQFGLRTLFALTTLVAICAGLFTARLKRAQEQAAAVSRVRSVAGGMIGYDLAKPLGQVPDGTSSTIYFTEVVHSRYGCFPRDWPPLWLEELLGVDFLGNVIEVGSWNYSGRDSDLADFKSFPKIKRIDFIFAPYVTDEGLVHLSGLSRLEHVRLGGSKITDEGIARFKQLRPNCTVER